MDAERHVAVFWDESVISAAGCSGFNAARFVCKAAETLGSVRSVKFYTTPEFATRGAFPNLRSEFKHAGVSIVDTASTGREASAVKMSLTDALIYALDNPPCPILFVSADLDVCYTISLLRMRGYHAYLLCPSNSGPIFEEFQLPDDFDTSNFLDAAASSSSNDCGPPDRHQSHCNGTSPPSNETPKHHHPSANGQVNGFSTRSSKAPPLLSTGEIDAFRERFTTLRPKLDTAMTNTLRPHRHSFSSFGHSGLIEPEGPYLPPFRVLPTVPIPSVGPKIDPKGKGRAVDNGSTLNSPIVLTATSISVSRSNSFGSAYRGPPTSISTAPTSAMPWYRPDFKMGADGTFKAATSLPVEGVAGQMESVERRSLRTLARVARSESGGTDGSATPTATSGPTAAISEQIANPRGEDSSRASVLSGSELQVPSLRDPATPLAPERIQIHASPPAPTPVANPAPTGAPAIPNESSSATASGSAISPGLPSSSLPDQRERTEGLPAASAAPDPQTSRGLGIAPVNGQPSTPHGQSAHLAPSSTTSLRPTTAQPTASTSSATPACTTQSPPASIPGVPAHFHTLVHVLREHLNCGRVYVNRAVLCSELSRRQRNILVAAKLQNVKRPFVAYLNQAFSAGIILSGEGNVALAAAYR